MNIVREGLNVLVDDCRDFGDVIIRDPRAAIQVLRRLHKSIALLSMDNDMGLSAPYEGVDILRQFLQDCANAQVYPCSVHVVTSNSVAADVMRVDLGKAGYVTDNRFTYTK